MSQRATYQGEETRFLTPGNEYELHRLDDDPNNPGSVVYQVAGLPGRYIYDDVKAAQQVWKFNTEDKSDNAQEDTTDGNA